MNFNRLSYDTCTYQHNLKQSVGVGDYILGMPRVNCNACFPSNPSTGLLDDVPRSVIPQWSLVDVDSELMGLTRKASNCPTAAYIPDLSKDDTTRFPVGVPVADCRGLPNEDTRLSNPPSTLRGQGWNRWETLGEDPQGRAEVPFRFNVNNRLIVKDNHRPCIPTPINQSPALPPRNQTSDMVRYNPSACGSGVEESVPHAQYWGTCNSLQKLVGR
jgi:hypothetical protein